MKENTTDISRRSFIKSAGTATLGAALAPLAGLDTAGAATPAHAAEITGVSTRPFGRSGIQVPILSLGGMFDIPSNQSLLKQAIRWGATYWDTAHVYSGGRSEEGIGQYFKRYPDQRDKIFLVTKSTSRSRRGMSKDLATSLKRMNTSYADLYFLHGIRTIRELDDETRTWAEKAKAEKKIRFFGFSTHSNMEKCLSAASKLDWIDGIMMTYNYRLMHTDKMKAAVDACVKAGIGLTAMKTQGGGAVKTSTETELKLAGRFLEKGFTDKQAKLRAVWENPQVVSICSQMPNMTILMSNVAAALDKTKLSSADMNLLRQYASETASDYCAGCSQICESAIDGAIPVSDVMRCLMYARDYGEPDRARQVFRDIPREVREQISTLDYAKAEQRCPQKMAIGELMRAAVSELA